MMKRVTGLILLGAALAAVVIWNVWSRYKTPQARKDYLEQLVEKADETTLEVIALPREEWERMGAQKGRWKHPRTGAYTLRPVILCDACGQKIPLPALEHDPASGKPPPSLETYRCPKCGGRAIAPVKPWTGAP